MRKILLSTVLFLLLSVSSFAKVTPYNISAKVDITSIQRPFAEDSQEIKQEIEDIIFLQKNPDKKELKKAKKEGHLKIKHLTLNVKESLTKKSYPALHHLLKRSLKTADQIADLSKHHWKQKRPYIVDSRIKSLIKKPSASPAYPSGHTTESYVLAHILSSLMPKDSDKFYSRAEEIAQHRVLVGMHFQRDLNGGRELARMIFKELSKDKEFKKDFLEAKKEING